jgi:hypothetical protein
MNIEHFKTAHIICKPMEIKGCSLGIIIQIVGPNNHVVVIINGLRADK